MNMKQGKTKDLKEELDYLLSLEKAARIVGKSYEDMARTYNHSLADGELSDKFRYFKKIHTTIIDELESFLDNNVGQG